METPQNVPKLSTESQHKQKDGDAADWWLQQQSDGPGLCIRLTISVSVLLQDIIKIKRLGVV